MITDIGCLCEGIKKMSKYWKKRYLLTFWQSMHFEGDSVDPNILLTCLCFATSFRADQAFLWQGHKPDIKSNIFVARTLWSFSFSWCISSLAMLQIRMQAEYQSVVNVRRKGMLQSFASIFKEEGIRGLYRVICKILFNFCSGN